MLFEKVDKKSKDIVFVYTTCANIEEARMISLKAIEDKLAISADYWVVNSIYPWKNVIQEIDQCMIVFATQKDISDELVKHINAEHSYNVPMIIKTDTALTNPEYSFWVDSTLSSKDSYITEEEERLLKKQKKTEEEYHFEKLK